MQQIGLPIVPAIKLDNKNIGGHCTPLQGQINTIYADFEKAFDKVPHHLLLKELQSYNVKIRSVD